MGRGLQAWERGRLNNLGPLAAAAAPPPLPTSPLAHTLLLPPPVAGPCGPRSLLLSSCASIRVVPLSPFSLQEAVVFEELATMDHPYEAGAVDQLPCRSLATTAAAE